MKKIVIGAAISAVVLSVWLTHSKLERSKRESRVVQEQREAAHQAMLAPYQNDLRIGITRAEVDRYLALKNVTHSTRRGERPSDGACYEVSAIEEPGDGLACDRWSVFVALEFTSSGGSREVAQPSDVLRQISIKGIGHCL